MEKCFTCLSALVVVLYPSYLQDQMVQKHFFMSLNLVNKYVLEFSLFKIGEIIRCFMTLKQQHIVLI